MAKHSSRYGRSLLLTALIGALIGSATSLQSTMRADLGLPGGGGGSGGSSSKGDTGTCSGSACGTGTASGRSSEKNNSSKSSEKNNGSGGQNAGGGDIAGTGGGGMVGGDIGGGTVAGGGSGGDRDDEARKRAEEERKRAEEARKKAEEEWKRAESERVRIEEEARQRLRKEEEERQRRMEEARKNTQPPVGGEKEDTQQGCFSIGGEWTTDRALCMQPTTTKPPEKIEDNSDEERIKQAKEEELRRKMEVRYVASPESDQKRVVLLALIAETTQRLIALRDTGVVTNPEQRQFVESSIEWLRGGETYFTEARWEEELEQMAVYIRQIAEYAQEVVKEVRTATAGSGQIQENISNIFLRTERLLLVFPDILAILTRENIPTDQNLQSDYETLVQYFQSVKNACSTNGNSCTALDDVLTGMQHLQASVQSAIAVAGKPETEKLIREVVEARTK